MFSLAYRPVSTGARNASSFVLSFSSCNFVGELRRPRRSRGRYWIRIESRPAPRTRPDLLFGSLALRQRYWPHDQGGTSRCNQVVGEFYGAGIRQRLGAVLARSQQENDVLGRQLLARSAALQVTRRLPHVTFFISLPSSQNRKRLKIKTKKPERCPRSGSFLFSDGVRHLEVVSNTIERHRPPINRRRIDWRIRQP